MNKRTVKKKNKSKLDYELSRCHKKISDQYKEIQRLAEIEQASVAFAAGNQALIMQIILACGKKVKDGDELVGRNVTIPRFSVEETLAKYTTATRAEGDKVIIGVLTKE
jgi:hypothetical protein